MRPSGSSWPPTWASRWTDTTLDRAGGPGAGPDWPPCMRLLLVSDLHYNLPQLDWVVQAAPRFDLVVLAGDCLDVSSPVPLDVQTVVLRRYLA